jgi:hypothetical protein
LASGKIDLQQARCIAGEDLLNMIVGHVEIEAIT